MKNIKILLMLIILCFIFVSCAKGEESQIEEISKEETSISSESEVSKESEEPVVEEITDLEGGFKSLSYTIKSNWKVVDVEDMQIISADDDGMVIVLYTTLEDEKKRVKDFTIEDIEATLFSIAKNMVDKEGKEVTPEPIINKTVIGEMEAVYFEREEEIEGIESKVIIYILKDEDTLYYINFNTMTKDSEEYLPLFNDFLKTIENK